MVYVHQIIYAFATITGRGQIALIKTVLIIALEREYASKVSAIVSLDFQEITAK
jgi:hypothetical protein